MVVVIKREALFSDTTMRKWDYSKGAYVPYAVPAEYHCPLLTDLWVVVNCASCGTTQEYGRCYTSPTIHNSYGLGFGVCRECYELDRAEEMTTNNKLKEA